MRKEMNIDELTQVNGGRQADYDIGGPTTTKKTTLVDIFMDHYWKPSREYVPKVDLQVGNNIGFGPSVTVEKESITVQVQVGNVTGSIKFKN